MHSRTAIALCIGASLFLSVAVLATNEDLFDIGPSVYVDDLRGKANDHLLEYRTTMYVKRLEAVRGEIGAHRYFSERVHAVREALKRPSCTYVSMATAEVSQTTNADLVFRVICTSGASYLISKSQGMYSIYEPEAGLADGGSERRVAARGNPEAQEAEDTSAEELCRAVGAGAVEGAKEMVVSAERGGEMEAKCLTTFGDPGV